MVSLAHINDPATTNVFPGDPAFELEKIADYGQRRISLENLAHLDALPATGRYVLVGGPINRRGSGSTAAIFGLVPPER
jgi:kynurenine formamidase